MGRLIHGPLLVLAAALYLAGLLFLLAAPLGHPFELASHFTPQMAVAGTFLTGIATGAARVRLAVALTALSALIVVRWALVPAFEEPHPPGSAVPLRLAVFNAKGQAGSIEAFAEVIKEEAIDVAALVEAHGIAKGRLEALFEGYEIASDETAALISGRYYDRAVLISRYPFTQLSRGGLRPDTLRPLIVADVETASGPVRVGIAHPPPPRDHSAKRERDLTLHRLAQAMQGEEDFLVLGDFNITPWSPDFERLPGRRAGDPRLDATWPTGIPLLGIPIDHIMLGPGVRLHRIEVGPNLGSDHLPLLATVSIAQ